MIPKTFADSLKQFRELAGLTQLQLATRSGAAHTSINRWERGGSLPKRDNANRLDDALHADGAILAAWRRTTTGTGLPEWARDLDAIEHGARQLSIATPTLVPGYLQCEEYARFVFSAGQAVKDPDELDRLTSLRCNRLAELPHLSMTAVFPLSAVTGVPTDVAKQQVSHLLKWADTRRIALHVVPSGSILVVPTTPLMLFRLRDGDLVATSDHADGSVTLASESHDRMSSLFTAALAEALPPALSLKALKDIHE